MPDQNMNFMRSHNGYNPQEVNAAILELQNQISDLKKRNAALASNVSQYEDQEKQIQTERIKESLRITSIMNAAMKMAEQIENDALNKAKGITDNAQREAVLLKENTRHEAQKTIENANREAERIRSQTQADLSAARTMLAKLNDFAQTIRQNNEQYISGANAQIAEICKLISSALSGMSAIQPTYTDSSPPFGSISHTSTPRQAPQVTNYADTPPTGADPYQDFLKKMESTGQQPKYPQKKSSDIFLGQFEDKNF